uniref:myosin-binding protein 3-like n=1 Tax=Erigeron canadensis TaxID=72917 RepID=UPI001CB9B36A|nr:myosin-binding protein 3-like [Erigeron canadensis]
MNRQSTRFWTLNALIGAFLDLYVAFLLLFGSIMAFICIKFLSFFGISILGNNLDQNVNSEFKSLLVDYPTDKVSAVQFSAARKFPFDTLFYRVQNDNPNNDNIGLNLERNDGVRELEGEASCSSKSDARKVVGIESDEVGGKVDKEKRIDVKGKGGLNYRLRGGFRRRRKGSFDSGRRSSVSSSTNWVTCVDQQSNNEIGTTGGLEGSCDFEGETSMVVKSDFLKRIPANEADKDNLIVLLTRELEKSQAAQVALYIELDKERSASATAADEAMSMILRLQEEKASIEMESRQYQRMIEEKSAYDEEEMNILKEIVLRREREKHFLEKEVEAYRQMVHVENDQVFGDNNQDFTNDPSKSTRFRKNARLFEDVDFSKQDEPERTIAIVGEEEKGFEMKAGDTSHEADSPVYDVHVIDNEPKSTEKSSRRKFDQSRSGLEMSAGLPPVSSKSSLRRNSTSALDNERTRLDTEVEWLRERLRIVQDGREKLNFSIDNREKESLQLQLLEDIARQLQEIRMLTEPHTTRQASLPLASAKGLTKKRRCRSASIGPPTQSY